MHFPLLSEAFPRTLAVKIAAVVLGTLLLTASAKVQVPFWPVPMTMQTAVVLILGMAYGWRLGAATVALYLMQGLAGMPVFAGPLAGPAYFAGPTGGYLVGFLAAAVAVGVLAERGWDRTWGKAAVAMALGHAVIFAFGVAWLNVLFGAEKAVAVGLAPFWAATLLKTALGVVVVKAAWTLSERNGKV
jgi:biotin transport system substrate-specific component